jgi:hypothetical protein
MFAVSSAPNFLLIDGHGGPVARFRSSVLAIGIIWRCGVVWLRDYEVLVSSFLSRCHELLVVQQMRRLPAWRLEADVR